MFGWFRKYIRKIGVFGVEVEFHPPTETGSAKPLESVKQDAAESTPAKAGTKSNVRSEHTSSPSGKKPGMTFDEVMQTIRELHPDAILGRSVQEGGYYYPKAKRLTNFEMRTASYPCYGARQPNGKTMWLYLWNGKICCGDNEKWRKKRNEK